MLREFVKELADVYVDSALSLSESLQILALKKKKLFNGKNNVIKKAAVELLRLLEEGNSISLAFKCCPYIFFDEKFVAFIELGEKTGDLRKTISFLNNKLERKRECRTKIIEASVYPIFVICLAVVMALFLIRFNSHVDSFFMYKMIFLLILSCFGIFLVIFQFLKENKLYEAFLAMDFLMNSGSNVSVAIEMAEHIVGINSKIGKKLYEAKEKLEYGMNYSQAFDFGEKFEDAFYFAEKTGDKKKVFYCLSQVILKKDEKKRKFCMALVEPLFLMITGFFILGIVINVFLPIFSDFSMFDF